MSFSFTESGNKRKIASDDTGATVLLWYTTAAVHVRRTMATAIVSLGLNIAVMARWSPRYKLWDSTFLHLVNAPARLETQTLRAHSNSCCTATAQSAIASRPRWHRLRTSAPPLRQGPRDADRVSYPANRRRNESSIDPMLPDCAHQTPSVDRQARDRLGPQHPGRTETCSSE